MSAHDDLAKRTYLSIAQLAEYLGFTTASKTRQWLQRHPNVRRSREGKTLVVWRRDVDGQLVENETKQRLGKGATA